MLGRSLVRSCPLAPLSSNPRIPGVTMKGYRYSPGCATNGSKTTNTIRGCAPQRLQRKVPQRVLKDESTLRRHGSDENHSVNPRSRGRFASYWMGSSRIGIPRRKRGPKPGLHLSIHISQGRPGLVSSRIKIYEVISLMIGPSL